LAIAAVQTARGELETLLGAFPWPPNRHTVFQERTDAMTTRFLSRLGIQTYGFRNFPMHAQVIEMSKACEVDKIELCATHFDPAKDDGAAVLEGYAKGGIAVTAFFAFTAFGEDERTDRSVFEFAKLAKLPSVVGDLAPAKLAQADKLATEYGVNIAVHNHGRHHHYGSIEALQELFSMVSPSLGLCLDTAWALDSGIDPLEFAQRFRERLYGIHIKDFVFDSAGEPREVVVGTGDLDLDGINRYVIDTNFDGFYTLEYEGDADNPVPVTKECVEAIRASWARIGDR
jgi:sugar phosphate isomerase/epimerase